MVVVVGRASVFVGFWGVYCCGVMSDVVGGGGLLLAICEDRMELMGGSEVYGFWVQRGHFRWLYIYHI